MKDLVSCDEATVEALKARLKRATTIAEFQRVQCVLMRATLDCTAGDIAQVLGWWLASTILAARRQLSWPVGGGE